jgi:hypothetical protein
VARQLACLAGDGRLAYDGELLNYGAAQQFRFLKCLKISACDELGNVVGGLNDIREVQALVST